MTPTKPRPFLVVLATTVASQDGVVAARDSLRNLRTRPGAEQRLLPAIDHPIPGKCEPHFTLSTNYLPAPVELGTPAALGRERLWPAGSSGSRLPAGRFPSSPRPPRSARRPACPFPTPARLVPDELSLPPHKAALSRPAPRVPTRGVLSARREKRASGGCVRPRLGVGRRERQTRPSVPRRSRPGGGKRGTISLPG